MFIKCEVYIVFSCIYFSKANLYVKFHKRFKQNFPNETKEPKFSERGMTGINYTSKNHKSSFSFY